MVLFDCFHESAFDNSMSGCSYTIARTTTCNVYLASTYRRVDSTQGKPIDTVVALPIKDPYHITRNLLPLFELLQRQVSKNA